MLFFVTIITLCQRGQPELLLRGILLALVEIVEIIVIESMTVLAGPTRTFTEKNYYH